MALPSRKKDVDMDEQPDDKGADVAFSIVPPANGEAHLGEDVHQDTPLFPEIPIGMGLTAQLVWLTPVLAKEFLAKLMKRQRRIKYTQLQAIKDDLKAGRWRFNGEPIIFDQKGNLIDGQHRATGVVETGIPILVLVLRGVDNKVYASIGGAAKRSGMDAIGAMGYEKSKDLAAAATLLYRYEAGRIDDRHYIASPMAAKDVMERHPDLEKSLAEAAPTKPLTRSAGTATFCHYVFSRIDPNQARVFFRKLASGEELVRGSAILALRKRLHDSRGDRFDQIGTIRLIFKAWNQFRMGHSVMILKVSPNEAFPEPI